MKTAIRSFGRWLRIPINRRHAFRRIAEFHGKPRSLDEMAGWAMHFGTKGRFRVKTIQIRSEITALAERVAKLNPRTILEIGTSEGGTALLWANLATDRVITCDINSMGPRAELIERFPPPASACRVTLLTGDSHSAAFVKRVEAELGGQEVDFLFIDGDHREEGVAADYENYKHLVRKGGLIAFHDIAENQSEAGNEVQHFWKKIKGGLNTEELIENRDQVGFGIGVVRV